MSKPKVAGGRGCLAAGRGGLLPRSARALARYAAPRATGASPPARDAAPAHSARWTPGLCRAGRLRNTRATDVGSRPRLVAPRPAGARRTVRRGSLRRMGRSAGGHQRDRRGADRRGPGRGPRDCRALAVRPRLRPVGDRSATRDEASDDEPGDGTPRQSDGVECEVGGYLVRAIRPDAWDAIVALLLALDAGHPACFHAVMRGCRRLSNSTPEVDGLDNLLMEPEQRLHDVAADREQRRSQQGYSTAADARAFLEMARRRRRESRMAASRVRRRTRSRRRTFGPPTTTRRHPATTPHTCRRARWSRRRRADPSPRHSTPSSLCSPRPAWCRSGPGRCWRAPLPTVAPDTTAAADGARPRHRRQRVLRAESRDGVPRQHADGRVLRSVTALYGPGSVRCGRRHLQPGSRALAARWPGFETRCGPGNTTADPGATLPEAFLVDHDLVTAFEAGWAVLHEDVSMFVAEHLIVTLTGSAVCRRGDPGRTGRAAARAGEAA